MNSAARLSTAPISLEHLLGSVRHKFSSVLLDSGIDRNHVVIHIAAADIGTLFKQLKEDRELDFNFLVSVTAVDWMDLRDDRFEVVYHLLSLNTRGRLRVKVAVSEHKPEVDSLTPLWQSANFMEREAWDMFGITFKGHPNLKRILMYDEFKGHPLRKDYPIQAKQPRVALRYPEVENTARQMHRQELVKIRAKKNSAETASSTSIGEG